MRAGVVAAVGLTASLVGCGGGGADTLNCGYLAGDNCWKATAAMATGCLPPSSEIGVLSADGGSCTYASGDVVTFNPPLVFPLPDAPQWNFTVKTATGAPCLSYVDDASGGITLTVQGQTVKETPQGSSGLKLTCPDGASYTSANAFSLLSCPDANLFDSLPGTGYGYDNSSVSLSLTATANASSSMDIAVFSCHKATP